MNTYFFTMKQSHSRTGAVLGIVTGVVIAENEEDARNKAWACVGSDSRYALEVDDITDRLTQKGGFSFTVYKSEIR